MHKLITDVNHIKNIREDSHKENEKLLEIIESEETDLEKLNLDVKSYYNSIKNKIDCKECGECCRRILVVFEEKDIDPLAASLKMRKEDVIEKYFQKYEKFKCYVMSKSPCFFQKGNICSLYENRGTECREFPYLETREFSEIAKYVFQGYSICLIHFNVIEHLKSDYFHCKQ